jgi:predicted ester cyclase
MSITENKELVRQIVKGWNTVDGDVVKIHSLFDKYYAPGFIYHDASIGDTDREKTIQDMVTYLSAFPDANYLIDDILAEGDRTVIRCTLRATHKGTFKDLPASGKRITIQQFEIHKIVGSKIVEAWGFSDSRSMIEQIKGKER